jgi:alcohol dehydrogenase
MAEVEFGFQLATRVVFGAGAVSGAGKEAASLADKRVLLITDAGLVAAGLADAVVEAMKGNGLDCPVFSGISANPRDQECQDAAAAARETGAEAIVGLGGGSAIDVAKAAAALVTNGGRVKDWEDPIRLEKDPLPLLAVPTTAGTGSEVTWVAVITDEEQHYKMTLLDTRIAANVAVLDPELTISLPPRLTAATGMDALVHAIEAYTCKASNPVSDALALRAVELVGGALRRAVADGADRGARSDMLLGSLLAGISFGNADVGAVHCLGESLGGVFDTPHGLACAVFLPAVLEFNAVAEPARHARVAAALGVETSGMADSEAAAAAVAAVRGLMSDIGIPSLRRLQELSADDTEKVARLSAEHVCSPDNARTVTYDDYLALLRATYAA